MKKLIYILFLLLTLTCFQNKVKSQDLNLSSNRNWWIKTWVSYPLNSNKAKQLPLIKVVGNKFVDENGKAILFRGLCVQEPDKADNYAQWTKAYFEKVKETGAMVARIPVHPMGWRFQTPEKYMALLDSAVEWCTDLGMYVMIDWHSIGNLGAELFQHPTYNTTKTETFRFWRNIAIRYKGHNTVAFYEIFNEPTTYSGQLGKMEWAEWKKINEDIINMIRAIDPEPIPLVAGLNWGYDLKPIENEPIEAEGIGYVSHPYEFKQGKPYRENWEKNFGYVADKYPVIVTEYAFDLEPGMKTDESLYASQLIDYLEEKGIGWVCWIFDDVWPPSLVKSLKTYELTGSGVFFEKAMKGELEIQND